MPSRRGSLAGGFVPRAPGGPSPRNDSAVASSGCCPARAAPPRAACAPSPLQKLQVTSPGSSLARGPAPRESVLPGRDEDVKVPQASRDPTDLLAQRHAAALDKPSQKIDAAAHHLGSDRRPSISAWVNGVDRVSSGSAHVPKDGTPRWFEALHEHTQNVVRQSLCFFIIIGGAGRHLRPEEMRVLLLLVASNSIGGKYLATG